MTLNITVLTRKCIYQSADYRLVDMGTGKPTDFQTQKIFVVNAYRWSATVCFTGVGRTRDVRVHEWLSDRLGSVRHDDDFEHLIEELLKAETWLSHVPEPHNKHSFSVGAFLGAEPVFVLISNFERPSGRKLTRATKHLSVFKLRVKKPTVIVPGQEGAVTRLERKQLSALAAQDSAPQGMHSMLAEVNRNAAKRTANVSPACFTTHLRLTGEGDTRSHDVGNATLPQAIAMPRQMHKMLAQIADNQFGAGRWRVKGASFVRAGASEEYHETQLLEKPDDPNVHSNYGAFLIDKKCDVEGAEQRYRIALALNPNHVNALGNLANLLSGKGDLDQAADLYRRALDVAPGTENVSFNFANFLVNKLGDRVNARLLLDKAIVANPRSARLLILRGQLSLEDGDSSNALEDFRQARQKGGDQAKAEAGYAYAMHLSGAPVGDCIAAYRTAIGLNPHLGALRLNLAQLLFLKKDPSQAIENLEEALRRGLDEPAQLEALFYRLCHTGADTAGTFRQTRKLLDRGARLRWNVRPNIAIVRESDVQKAVLLEQVSKVMTGEEDQVLFDKLVTRW